LWKYSGYKRWGCSGGYVAITFSTDVTPVQCGTTYGEINVSVNGGHEGFTYYWNHPNLNGTNPTGLASDAYTLTAMDQNGCTAETTIIVPAIGSLDISINELNPITCFGYNSGQLEANVNGIVGALDYQWDTGSHSQIISNLNSGNYQVTINDNYG